MKILRDNYKKMSKPAQTLADREWRGRTELRLVPGVRTHTAQHWVTGMISLESSSKLQTTAERNQL